MRSLRCKKLECVEGTLNKVADKFQVYSRDTVKLLIVNNAKEN